MSEKLKYAGKGSIPPGGYRYEIDGKTIRGNTLDETYKNVLAYCIGNNLAPPTFEDMEDWFCRQLPAEWCRGPGLVRRLIGRPDGSITLASVLQATGTILSWYRASKCEPLPESVVASRVAICIECEYNVEAAGCKGCGAANALRRLFSGAFKQIAVPNDEKAKQCKICGCELKIKTRIPNDILLKHMPAPQIDKLPSHCWLKKSEG